jgi:curved DNA-binding protein
MKENWEINWKDYYKTLQVDQEAEPEIIKGAFERLARKYHPDLNSNSDATQRMTEINEAYGILGDAEKRSSTDK